VAVFYVSYVVFEITGAILVERWSARKWIARIMISWGVVTILIGFVQTARQFYAAMSGSFGRKYRRNLLPL
jgi:ACS family tartrate transporter-like MFS transporter